MSGRSGLTYREALESERTETDRVKEKLPDELQKRVLQRAQFRKLLFIILCLFLIFICILTQIQLIIYYVYYVYSIEIGRLDKVVNDVYDYYVDRFDSGDLVTCRWTDGVK